MKSNLKNTNKNRRFSQILFSPSRNIKNQKESTDEPIKNTDLYKKNTSSNRARIVFFYKMKYLLKKRIYSPYFDTATNYNKMIINNILSNGVSSIKERYTEMLNEIETNDLVCKFVLIEDVYYFLKYLVVVYDKFHKQYPNYLKDINVYYFMSQYLIKKQKNYDYTKENNKYIYITEKIKKLFSQRSPIETKLITANLSHSDSEEENYHRFKQLQGQGFDIDLENSEDSINKLESLVGKIDKNLANPQNLPIYVRSRSKSLKNIDTFLIKYSNFEKPKKVKWSMLYGISPKKFLRSKKKKGTEIKHDRKKVFIETVIEKTKVKKKLFKKIKKEELRKSLLKKRNEINEIRKIILENDVGKNNTLLDVVKRGFVFNDNENKVSNKNLLISSYKKKDIKFDDNKLQTKNEKTIKEKIMKLHQNNNLNPNNYYNVINHNLFKKKKFIIKNLNDCLNEYRFYNQIIKNSLQRQKYYEKRVIPGLFNNKVHTLFNINNINEKSNKPKIYPSIGNATPIQQKYYNKSCGSSCKKLTKGRKVLINKKIKINNLLLPYSNSKNKSEYYTEGASFESEKRNSKLFINQMQRLENSIYTYYKSNKKEKGIPLSHYKLNYFNNINLTDINDSEIKLKNKKFRNNVLTINTEYNIKSISKNKMDDYLRKNREKIFLLKINNNNNNKYLPLNIKNNNNKNIKEEKSQTLNNFNSLQKIKKQNAIKIKFSNTFNTIYKL